MIPDVQHWKNCREEANRESETIPEDIQDLIKTSELQIVSEETEDETIMPLVDQK